MLKHLLIPFEQEGKWGFVNYHDSIIVSPIFEEAYPTFSNRGRIKQNGKYGFINEKGKIVIKPKYDTATDFKNGAAQVSRRGKSKRINIFGKKNATYLAGCGGIFRNCLSPRRFYGIDTFKVKEKYRITVMRSKKTNGKLTYYSDTLNTLFDQVTSIGRQYVILEKNKKKALLFEYRGAPATYLNDDSLNFEYEAFQFFPCHEFYQFGSDNIFGFKKNGKWGYIKLFYRPKIITKATYLSISSMKRGVALVEYKSGKFGYVSSTGKEYFNRN